MRRGSLENIMRPSAIPTNDGSPEGSRPHAYSIFDTMIDGMIKTDPRSLVRQPVLIRALHKRPL